MATAVSFDEIIQAGRPDCQRQCQPAQCFWFLTALSFLDRQRKKNEELANRLLGKSKKAVDSEASNKAAPKSLASRIGVVKVMTASFEHLCCKHALISISNGAI